MALLTTHVFSPKSPLFINIFTPLFILQLLILAFFEILHCFPKQSYDFVVI